MVKNIFEWFILIWTSLLVLLISFLILFKYYNADTEIIGGIIGFTGAIIGGLITYIGVKITLKHRDRELFLSNINEKLMILDELRDTYSKYLTPLFLLENKGLKELMTRNQVQAYAHNIYNQLLEDRKDIYKSMDYNDAIEILNLHKKGLTVYVHKDELSEEEAKSCINKIRDIFQVIQVTKEQLERKHRELRIKV